MESVKTNLELAFFEKTKKATLAIYNSCQNGKLIRMTELIKEYSANMRLPKALYNLSLLKGTKRYNYVDYEWIGGYPDDTVIKRIVEENRKVNYGDYSRYRISRKSILAEKSTTEEAQLSEQPVITNVDTEAIDAIKENTDAIVKQLVTLNYIMAQLLETMRQQKEKIESLYCMFN